MGQNRRSDKPLEQHIRRLSKCRQCPAMVPPVITCGTVRSKCLLLGQAPGAHEGEAGRPFAWTAGKTLFKWFGTIGISEEQFRSRVYMAAVCRCFPGKAASGGDRVPDQTEIDACSDWLENEMRILKPALVIPVGRLAIAQLMEFRVLKDVVGSQFEVDWRGFTFDAVPLPHPSGASTWHRTNPGRKLLAQALKLIEMHPAFAKLKGR